MPARNDLPPAALDHARNAAHGLPRALFFAALVELVAAAVRPFFEPGPVPVVLADIAAVARFLVALLAALALARLVQLARLHRLAPVAHFAVALFALAGLTPLLRFFDIVPATLSEPLWDSVLIATYGALLIFATATALWLMRLIALARRILFPAHRLATALFPLVFAIPVGLGAIDPSLLPHPVITPALALLTPWSIVFGRGSLMRWDLAAWVTLFLCTVGGLLTFLDTTLALPGLAIAAVAFMAALAAAKPLHELADQLSGRETDGPTATFLRRLVAGTLGGAASSRIGDLPAHSQVSDESNAEESLALAYRELGIEPQPSSHPPRPVGDGLDIDLPPAPANLVPFVPKSRQQHRPEPDSLDPTAHPDDSDLAPPRLDALDWGSAQMGLHDIFTAVLGLTLLLSFGLLFALSPLAQFAVAQAIFDVTLGLASTLALRGVTTMLRPDSATARPPHVLTLRIAQALFALTATLSLASAVSHFAFPDTAPLRFIAALTMLAALFASLLAIAGLGATLDDPRLGPRARTAMGLAVSLMVLHATRFLVLGLDASDLQWLAWPLGVAAAGVFIGLAIILLWLLRDAEDAANRAVVRQSHADR